MAEKEKRKKPEAETPSAMALYEVGKPKADASDEDKVAHHERYQAVKRKWRWG